MANQPPKSPIATWPFVVIFGGSLATKRAMPAAGGELGAERPGRVHLDRVLFEAFEDEGDAAAHDDADYAGSTLTVTGPVPSEATCSVMAFGALMTWPPVTSTR